MVEFLSVDFDKVFASLRPELARGLPLLPGICCTSAIGRFGALWGSGTAAGYRRRQSPNFASASDFPKNCMAVGLSPRATHFDRGSVEIQHVAESFLRGVRTSAEGVRTPSETDRGVQTPFGRGPNTLEKCVRNPSVGTSVRWL